MYCSNCGAQMVEGAVFCTECGERVVADGDCSSGAVLVGKNGNDNKKSPGSRRAFFSENKKKIVVAVAVVVALACVVVGALVFVGSSAGREDVHIPEPSEVQDQANMIEGGNVSLESDRGSDYDKYYILLNDEYVGSVFFSSRSSENVGVYVEKDKCDDAREVFAQIGVAAIKACDPALDLEDAKEILSQAVDGALDDEDDPVKNNGVEYKSVVSSDRYILRIQVPDVKAK